MEIHRSFQRQFCRVDVCEDYATIAPQETKKFSEENSLRQFYEKGLHPLDNSKTDDYNIARKRVDRIFQNPTFTKEEKSVSLPGIGRQARSLVGMHERIKFYVLQ